MRILAYFILSIVIAGCNTGASSDQAATATTGNNTLDTQASLEALATTAAEYLSSVPTDTKRKMMAELMI